MRRGGKRVILYAIPCLSGYLTPRTMIGCAKHVNRLDTLWHNPESSPDDSALTLPCPALVPESVFPDTVTRFISEAPTSSRTPKSIPTSQRDITSHLIFHDSVPIRCESPIR